MAIRCAGGEDFASVDGAATDDAAVVEIGTADAGTDAVAFPAGGQRIVGGTVVAFLVGDAVRVCPGGPRIDGAGQPVLTCGLWSN